MSGAAAATLPEVPTAVVCPAWAVSPTPRVTQRASETLATMSAVFFERQLAVMFSQKVEESFVVARFHVEEACQDAVIAACFLETASDNVADVDAGDLASHIHRVHRRPERLALFDQPLVQVVGD